MLSLRRIAPTEREQHKCSFQSKYRCNVNQEAQGNSNRPVAACKRKVESINIMAFMIWWNSFTVVEVSWRSLYFTEVARLYQVELCHARISLQNNKWLNYLLSFSIKDKSSPKWCYFPITTCNLRLQAQNFIDLSPGISNHLHKSIVSSHSWLLTMTRGRGRLKLKFWG